MVLEYQVLKYFSKLKWDIIWKVHNPEQYLSKANNLLKYICENQNFIPWGLKIIYFCVNTVISTITKGLHLPSGIIFK